MINIYPKHEKNNLYKCHFCQQNIDVYGIEKHFATFHKFRRSIESDYVCEFCDDFEEFNSQANLFHHIQNTHNFKNDEKIKKEGIVNVNTLEEGKSRFLQLILNLNSQEDVFNLLQWIKFNDTNVFMTNHEEIENEVLVYEENLNKTTKDDDDNEENTLNDDMDNSDSNLDLGHETEDILIQRDYNTFMTEDLGIVDVVEENISKTTAENDENIVLKDMDNTDSNSIGDFDQESDVILSQREIVHSQESSDEDAFEEEYNNLSKSDITITMDNGIHLFHKELKDYMCESCGKSFSKAKKLISHIYTVHEEHKDYKCESCGKSFSRAEHLKRHIHTVHDGHRDYKCESCDKLFTSVSNMKQHINAVHEGHKDYKCESCGKSFSQTANLKKHNHTVHEGRKDYKCESCGKSFFQAGYLKKHNHTVHEGNRDYKCDSCGKLFSRPGTLKKHIHTVHEGHKDYICDSCGKSFIDLSKLERHFHTVHDGYGDYKCETCGKSFSAALSLRRHILKVHEGQIEDK